MNIENLNKLTDQELLEEAKNLKSNILINAFMIGFLIGIIFYGVVKNSIGFFGLIPLFILFKFFHKPEQKEYNKAVKKLLEERKLKSKL